MVRKDDANIPAPPKVEIIVNPNDEQPHTPLAVAMKEPDNHVPLSFNLTPIVRNIYTFMLMTMPSSAIIVVESAKFVYVSVGTWKASKGEKKRYSSNMLKTTKNMADTATAIPI